MTDDLDPIGYDPRNAEPPTDSDLALAMRAGVSGLRIIGALTDSRTGDRIVLLDRPPGHVTVTRRTFDLTLEIQPVAVTGEPLAVRVQASYPDGSHDASTGNTVEQAIERIGWKIAAAYHGRT